MTAAHEENLPEALDEGADTASAILAHLPAGKNLTPRNARDIAHSLPSQQQFEQASDILRTHNPDAGAHILLAACGVGNDNHTTFTVTDPRTAAKKLREAADAARWDLRHRLLLTAERLENGDIPGPERDPAGQREQRREGRRLARLPDLHRLAHHNHDDTTTRAAAHTIHHEQRRADLLTVTYDPPEPLCRELAAHAHHNPYHDPADLGDHPPELIAARLHQAAPLGGAQSPHGARWLHTRHPVLWLTGHDEHPAEDAGKQTSTTPEANMRALALTPTHWYRHAVNASRRSRTSIIDAAARGLDPVDQETVRSLAASWTLGLEELRRTAHTLNRH